MTVSGKIPRFRIGEQEIEERGLQPMIVFSGALDLLYPDSIDLAAKARATGVPIELHLRPGQPHDYAGMPTPEGRQSLAIILRVVARGLTSVK